MGKVCLGALAGISHIKKFISEIFRFSLLGPKWAWMQSHEWAWFGGLVLGGFTVASMNEFGLAVILFGLAGVSAASQLWSWEEAGISKGATKLLRGIGSFFIVIVVLASWGIVNVYRDGKRWSQFPKAVQNARNWFQPNNQTPNGSTAQETRPPIDPQPPTSITIVTPGEMPFYPSKFSHLTLDELFKENHIGNIRIANNNLYTFAGSSGISTAALLDEYGVYSVLFYVPHGESTFSVCMRLSQQTGRAWWCIEDSITWAEKMGFAIDKTGASRMRIGNPIFSKHVILYAEDMLELSQKGIIQDAFKKNGLSVDFRDADYVQQEIIDRAHTK